MKCPHCNQEHPEGYIFCPFTGEKIIQLKACTLNPDCPEHGKFIWPLDSIFCSRCGSKLEGRADDSAVKVFTVKGVSFKMINVEGGTFTMGASADDTDADDNEKPAHQVTLSSFAIGQTEVTQELWLAVMGNNPSSFTGDLQRPVEMVSWYDCLEFISMLNRMIGKNFRLPTEAEWEYAARGGKKSQGYKYAGSDTIADVAWNNKHPRPVATKAPNELGLYDMSGNVFEWCQDWYDYDYYSVSPSTNPTGPSTGSERVHRGGSWRGRAKYCRMSCRSCKSPYWQEDYLGLRLAL